MIYFTISARFEGSSRRGRVFWAIGMWVSWWDEINHRPHRFVCFKINCFRCQDPCLALGTFQGTQFWQSRNTTRRKLEELLCFCLDQLRVRWMIGYTVLCNIKKVGFGHQHFWLAEITLETFWGSQIWQSQNIIRCKTNFSTPNIENFNLFLFWTPIINQVKKNGSELPKLVFVGNLKSTSRVYHHFKPYFP